MIFRKATKQDLDACWTILRDARDEMLEKGRKQWDAAYPTREIVEQDIENTTAYVLINENKIVVYASLKKDGESAYADSRCLWQQIGHYLAIHRMAVAINQRGKGFAKTFLNEVTRLAETLNLQSIKTDTNFDNLEMLQLLRHAGFQQRGTVYYAKGNRIAFEKSLQK